MTDDTDIELIDQPAEDTAAGDLHNDPEVQQHYYPPPLPPPPPAPPPLDAVLAEVDEDMRPRLLPACATCPAALWRVRQLPAHDGQPAVGFDCYCQIMHQFTFDSQNAVAFVKECGGRMKELAALELANTAEHDTQPKPAHQP